MVFGGHQIIAEAGVLIAENQRFAASGSHLVADLDTQWLQHDRSQTPFPGPRPTPYRIVKRERSDAPSDLLRDHARQPFVPTDEHELDTRAAEILQIQATGLARRMQAAHSQAVVIGLSGGLDSTLAFLVAFDALQKLDLAHINYTP